MGAAPGPACYGLGGRNATVTDAFVVVGHALPDRRSSGGRRTLDVERAREALDQAVGAPLGVATDDAARRSSRRPRDAVASWPRDRRGDRLGSGRVRRLRLRRATVRLFATAVAERLGAGTVRLFGFGNVLSAYGSAISDVVHVYESALDRRRRLAGAGGEAADEARRDLRGEGFDPDGARP